MFRWSMIMGIAGTLCLHAGALQAQSVDAKAAQSDPVEILEIGFSDAGLSGSGGERLKAALEDAQFIAVGEALPVRPGWHRRWPRKPGPTGRYIMRWKSAR